MILATENGTSFRLGAPGIVGVFCTVLALCACSAPEPVQSVNFKQRLSMEISDQWVAKASSGKKASFALAETRGVVLSFEDQTRDYGTPMTVQGVRSAIGGELNRAYGGVDARMSLGGNAMLSYPLSRKHGSKKVYTHNWVVAKPIGYSAVARVAITLRVPEGEENSPEVQAMIDRLDKQVGDAVMPSA